MALNSSGPISLAGTTAGQSIELENGGNGTTQISLNDTAVRALAGVTTPNSTIIMPTNFWGKSNYYTINNSVRLRRGSSAYLSRTPGTASNRQTWTWSAWVKRGQLSVGQIVFSASDGSSTQFYMAFESSGVIRIADWNDLLLLTTPVYRDPSAWYHVVIAMDTTQATSSNRCKLYINGTQVTAFSTATYPAQNYNTAVNNTNPHAYGREEYGDDTYFDGYIAETYLINAQQLTPSSFGETNASTGVWQPKAYTGTYGTNGFYLKFSDIATTSGSNAGLGKDFSGNGNYWNTNNISVTPGYTYDAMLDVPTWNSATVANFCVVNTLANFGSGTNSIYNANLSHSGSTNQRFLGTIGVTSGKWYFEHVVESTAGAPTIGIANQSWGGAAGPGTNTGSWGVWLQTGGSGGNGVAGPSCGAFAVGDILQVAYDMDAGYVWFGRNNTWAGSGNPSAGTNPAFTGLTGTMFMAFQQYAAGSFNFGQRAFNYTPPTNFKRLNTYNLPTPTIGATSSTLAGKYFNAVLYSGNGTTNTITGLGFQPDFLWFKNRNGTGNHSLNNTNRGITKRLISDSTNAEDTISSISSLNSDGFVLTGNDGAYNYSVGPRTYVTWCWKANAGTNSTNTNGSITSTVQANTTSGFSIVRWTGTGASGTTGHGLSVAPKMIILKDATNAYNWYVFTTATGSNLRFEGLNTTSAATSQPSQFTTTSTLIENIPSTASLNTSGATMIAYCFAEVAGFSKIGTYTGNNSSDGPFIYCGFRPRFIMIKRSDAASDWFMYDTARSTYNVGNQTLAADATTDEGSYASTNYFDFVSNGFKIRQDNNSGYNNASGGTYIFMAFAESPFNYSLAR